MIECKNLTVAIDAKQILNDINLTIPSQKTTVILGRSGCGKSVLVKTIIGLIKPQKGQILFNQFDFLKATSKERYALRKQFSMLFQGAALFDSMNIYQNVAFPLIEHTNLPECEIIKRTENTLAQVGLFDIMEKMPSELSGGMKKRAGMARAIISQPSYIIYDEPTTGLDPITGSEIIALIEHISHSLQITSIIITHDMVCTERLSDQIIMLGNQKVQFAGTFNEFINSTLPDIQDYISQTKLEK